MDKKIRVLILGWKGMLGNALVRYISSNENIYCAYTMSDNFLDKSAISFRVSESCIEETRNILSEWYDYVINCIWVIRPSDEPDSIRDTLFINAYFPQILAHLASSYAARVIHISTDCVFSGKIGNYSDKDIPDEMGIYGLSKFLGEIRFSPHITLRTSIIWRELWTQKNLLDWFLMTSESRVFWYANVMWNGVTTLVLSRIIERIIINNLFCQWWLFQIGSERVSKLHLLEIFKEIYNKDIEIIPREDFISDKTILSSREISQNFSDLILPIYEQVADLYDFYK